MFKKNLAEMQREYGKLIELIERYGDCCRSFGEYQTIDHILNCSTAKEDIENFLKEMLDI